MELDEYDPADLGSINYDFIIMTPIMVFQSKNMRISKAASWGRLQRNLSLKTTITSTLYVRSTLSLLQSYSSIRGVVRFRPTLPTRTGGSWAGG